jgi:hypothetical protein
MQRTGLVAVVSVAGVARRRAFDDAHEPVARRFMIAEELPMPLGEQEPDAAGTNAEGFGRAVGRRFARGAKAPSSLETKAR